MRQNLGPAFPLIAIFLLGTLSQLLVAEDPTIPEQVPSRRSMQLSSGFGTTCSCLATHVLPWT